jgi:hypothetical protein
MGAIVVGRATLARVKLSGQIGIGMDLDGTLDLMAVGEDNNIYEIHQVTPSNGWSDWASLGYAWKGGVDSPALAVENVIGAPALTVYYAPGEELAWQSKRPSWGTSWQTRAAPSPFGLGSTVVVGLIGRRQSDTIFGGDSSGKLWMTTGDSSPWTNLTDLAGGAMILGPVAVAPSLDGRLELFGAGWEDFQLHHIWETRPGGAWSPWYSHGAPPGFSLLAAPALAPNQDGRLELFVVGTTNPIKGGGQGSLFHIWQTAAGGAWSDWYSHGAP